MTSYDELLEVGIQQDDPRISKLTDFSSSELARGALHGNLIIPNWKEFVSDVTKIFNEVKDIKEGKNAHYIPQLSNVDPNYFGVAICTIDGQILEIGDTNISFSIQSCSKPITYCIAVTENDTKSENDEKKRGESIVHNFFGREPSGRNFNELCMNHENIPHNPMINAGSIACVSLIDYKSPQSERYDKIIKYWSRLCGNEKIGFNNSVYLSEKSTADRNFCLGYMMQEKQAFQRGKDDKYLREWTNSDLEKNLDLYFQCCSIEVTCTQVAKIGSTLANGGFCPYTNDRVFESNTVKNALSLMHSCGMYDYSGEWSYLIGIPAKSGVSGVVFAVIPNVMCIAVYSPPLDVVGNSVKGVKFFKKFTNLFNFHTFDSLVVNNNKKSITKQNVYQHDFNRYLFLEAASKNNIDLIKKLLAQKIDIDTCDYDGRSALHVAASNKNIEIVRYLLINGANKNLRDRWNNKPIDDADREKCEEIQELLKE